MNKLSIVVLGLLLGAYLCPVNAEKIAAQGYAEIAAIALESEKLIGEEIPKIEPHANLKDKANALLKVQSDIEIKRLVFRLFDKADKRPFTSIMHAYSLREINVLVGDGENKDLHLLAQIDKTKSFAGKAVLTRLISEPIHSLDLIKQRQAAL